MPYKAIYAMQHRDQEEQVMSFTTILYERNGAIRFPPSGSASVNARGKTPGQAKKTQGVTRPLLGPAKRRIRNGAVAMLFGAIWNAVRSVGLWIEENSREAHYRRVESYLAQSSNHADLERRMRQLERNSRLNWIDCGSR